MNYLHSNNLVSRKRLAPLADGSPVTDFYWVAGAMCAIMFLVGVVGSVQKYIALNTLAKGVHLAVSDLWWVIDVRHFVTAALCPILASVIVQRASSWFRIVSTHVVFYIFMVAGLGLYLHRLEHFQSSQMVNFVSGNAKPYDEHGCHGTIFFWVREMSMDLVSYLFLLAVGSAIFFLRVNRRRARQAEQLSGALLQAQYDALTNQLQPHFLLNALNSIGGLIMTKPDAACESIGHLGSLLKHAVKTLPRRGISLKEEVSILENYLEVQQSRFGEKLTYDISVEEGLGSLVVPPFILQPIVENSFKHAFEPLSIEAKVSCHAYKSGDRCIIEISDNGWCPSPMNFHKDRGGLSITRDRIRLQHESEGDLRFDRNSDGGLKVTLSFPLIANPSHVNAGAAK